MATISWSDLSLAEATELTLRWEAQRAGRLAWLEDRIAAPVSLDVHGIDRAWRWYLEWKDHPVGSLGQDPPVWWVDDGGLPAQFTREQSIGLDALGHLWEAALLAEFPQLVRFRRSRGRSKYKNIDEHYPQLALVVDGKPVVSQNTFGLLFTMGDYANVGRQGVPLGSDYLTGWFNVAAEEVRDQLAEGAHPASAPSLRDRLAGADLVEIIGDEDDANFPWQVHLSDELAHDHEELAQAFARALADAPGVTEAFHEDRGVISLSGQVDEPTLEEWAKEWWRQHLPE